LLLNGLHTSLVLRVQLGTHLAFSAQALLQHSTPVAHALPLALSVHGGAPSLAPASGAPLVEDALLELDVVSPALLDADDDALEVEPPSAVGSGGAGSTS
jgi:hypothetical protein